MNATTNTYDVREILILQIVVHMVNRRLCALNHFVVHTDDILIVFCYCLVYLGIEQHRFPILR